MATPQSNPSNLQKPLRLWPGVLAVALLWLLRFVVPIVLPEAVFVGVIGELVGALAIVLWWAFFSRAPRAERWGGILLMIVAVVAARLILHPSIRNGMMGMMFLIYVIPTLSLAFVAWAVVTRRLSDGARRASMVAAILLGCGVWGLVRTNGITGDAVSDFAWRWTKTAEERLLAQGGGRLAAGGVSGVSRASGASEGLPAAPAVANSPEKPLPTPAVAAPAAVPAVSPIPAATQPSAQPLSTLAAAEPAALPPARTAVMAEKAEKAAAWPGFRGPDRDDSVRGVRIGTDWSKTPPVQLWRRPIGPGWSSFAVRGDRLYTQEQRGEDEVVACYNMTTGEPVWSHRDAARFWESNAGAGPRATPTLSDGRVYTFGATGIVNALDAADGAVVWSRNAGSDTGVKVPGWGFASSPLVVDDVVIVAAAGRLVAYDRATGKPRWQGPAGGWGYSSPQRATIDGVAQVLLLNGAGAISVAPADGTLLWEHKWQGDGIVQPAVTADGDVLIGNGSGMNGGMGVRRIAVAHGPAGWTTQERWTSIGLKPYFNDFVVHAGHAYGFDGGILACIDLQDGQRKWKGGRYGHGQLLLLADQDLLLVQSEKGELALVRATPDQFTELARFPAVEGKTWNHPVLVGDILLARNGQEMVAFRLSPAGG